MTEVASADLSPDPDRYGRAAGRSMRLWAVAVASVGVITGSLVLTLASKELDLRGLRAFLLCWIVLPYAVSGMVAWWRRPASRLGPLMLVTALGMALTPLQWLSQPLVHSIGNLFDMLPAALFLHVFLAFPTGRLSSRADRLLVGFCYLAVLGLQLVKVTLGAARDSVFVVVDRPSIGNLVEGIQLSVVAGLLLGGAVSLYLRSRAAGHWMRRPTALVVDAFGVALVMLALLYVAGLAQWSAAEAIRLVTFASLGLAPIAFLFALLDARLARGEVAGLMIELRDHPTTDLQGALARALRDPSLQLAYWLPEFQSWVDQNGRPRPPERNGPQAVRIIMRDGEPMAALLFHTSLEEESELVDAVAAAAEIAMENGRLRAELHARLEELKTSRVRVFEAGRKERQRLERDLHDGAQQRLVALSLELGILGEGARTDEELHARLLAAKREVSASLEELRDVARGIYPAVLAGHGLAVAVESLVARARVPVSLQVDLPGRLPEPLEAAAYYVVSEAVTNLDKHARADSAAIRICRDESRVVLTIADDGVGGADPTKGSGLRGLADRVEAVGGHLQITSDSATGTSIRAELPCQ